MIGVTLNVVCDDCGYVTLSLQWVLLGVNISNIGTGGIWTILFHLGLGGKPLLVAQLSL